MTDIENLNLYLSAFVIRDYPNKKLHIYKRPVQKVKKRIFNSKWWKGQINLRKIALVIS